jgi:hypothetical protein
MIFIRVELRKENNMYQRPVFLGCLFLLATSVTGAQTWEPVAGADNLSALFSDTVMTTTLKDGVVAKATYNSDGTGELMAWGDSFARSWQVKGDGQVCLTIDDQVRCFTIEKESSGSNRYRAQNVETGEVVIFDVNQREITVSADPDSDAGGASQPSAEEIAQKLANPNAPMASLTFRLQQRWFDGDLPDAGGQSGTTLVFQPSFPFSLDNGDVVFFRPGIPILMGSPSPNAAGTGFTSESGLGDIAFDVAYGRTTKTGMLYAGGMIVSLPTATNDALGTDRYTMGPEFMIGKLTKKWVIGAFPNHQWDVGGSGDKDINLTTIQLFGTVLPGGGWNYGSSPIITFDHISDQWTIPLNVQLGKTVIWGGRPWKLSTEINYFVEQSDAFGPEWMIGFNVAPVVENVLASWFK